ncbi:YncE family protein [Actinophytocola sediminis]
MIVAAVICSAAAGTACSTTEPSDELMVSDNPVAATAARSPAAQAAPAGTVTALSGTPTSMAVDAEHQVLAVAVDKPPAVLLYRLTDADTLSDPTTVSLPGPARSVTLAGPGGPLLASVDGELVRITLPDGEVDAAPVDGDLVSAVEYGDRTLVAVRDRKAVAVLGGDKVYRMISGGLYSADQVLSTGENAVVFDRLRNAVFQLDVPAGTVDEGLRAGEGSTNAVTDRFGRVLVADTRGGALLAFSVDPLLMRQRYPVAGSPYGLAYDQQRDLVWVTLTERNEVVGFDVAGEEPVERHRFPTVEQPNSVAVDPSSGRVVVASATGKGIQVIAV